MTRGSKESGRAAANQRVLQLITEAIDLIDAHGGSAEAAAYLELARQKILNLSA